MYLDLSGACSSEQGTAFQGLSSRLSMLVFSLALTQDATTSHARRLLLTVKEVMVSPHFNFYLNVKIAP